MRTIPKHKTLTNFQMFSLLTGVMIGTGILSLPRDLGQTAGHDLWISLLVGGGLVLIGGTISVLLCRKFPDSNVFEMSETLLGRFFGAVIAIYYTLFGIAGSAVVTRIYSDIIASVGLIRTPQTVVILLILLVVTYLLRGDITVLGRYSEIVTIIIFPAIVIYFANIQNFNTENFLPVGVAGIENILKATAASFYSFFGFEFILVFYPFLKDKKYDMKIMWYVIHYVTAVYIISCVFIVGFFGIGRTTSIFWPIIGYLKTFRIPFFERIDQLYLIIWMQTIFITVAGTMMVSLYGFSHLFRLKHHKYALPVVALAVFIAALIPRNVVQTYKYADIVGYMAVGTMFIIPVFLYQVSLVKGLVKGNERS